MFMNLTTSPMDVYDAVNDCYAEKWVDMLMHTVSTARLNTAFGSDFPCATFDMNVHEPNHFSHGRV